MPCQRRLRRPTAHRHRHHDGGTDINWAKGSRPEWAEHIDTDVRDNVLVGVTIKFSTGVAPGTLLTWAASLQAKAQKNLVESHKQLYQKYGKPTREHVAGFTDGQKIPEPEWDLPGIRVTYKADLYDSIVKIQLESVALENAKRQEEEEEAAPKL